MGDASNTSAVAENSETHEEEDESAIVLDESAIVLDDAPDAASLPPAMMNEVVSEVAHEEEPHSFDATDKERARVVTFIEQGAADGTRTKRHRVRTAAREAVEENLLPRVEKLRQASNVVLDEAAYDPSLRFILIAVALFIIFLLILFASKVLG
jgi:hypothetical protein